MRSKWSEILVHIVVWLLLIFVPLLSQLEDDSLNVKFMSRVWLMLFGLLITFYSNYLGLINAFFYKNRWFLFILFNLLIFFAESTLSHLANEKIDEWLDIVDDRREPATRGMKGIFLYNDMLFYLMGVAAALGVSYYKRLSQSEMMRKKLEAEKLTSEITLLKYQLQPHFFFNTLNNIYALISKSPAEAQNAVHSLSKMMRYILYENTSPTISLANEIAFMENYGKLMRLRLTDNVTVKLDFPHDHDDLLVPPLLFIPLLENAFKHGVVGNEAHHFINCRMTVEPDKLLFFVENSTCNDKEVEDRSHSGIGLSNLRKRLEILYGHDYSLYAQSETTDSGDKFVAQLEIPLHQPDTKQTLSIND